MKNLLDELVKILSEDSRLVSEGKLMKNKIVELAMNLDSSVIRHLLNNAALKAHFFKDIDGILAFDKIKFQQFLSNKSFLPDSFTSYKNKIGLVSDNNYLADSKEFVLAWPYKDCVLEGGQDIEDAKRDEIFWNETLAPDEIDRLLSPKALINFRKYGEKITEPIAALDISESNSLLIKGNNLLALHSLKKVYSGKVKLIYIDPPYNPDSKANTFCYNNRFNHSTWLTFIKNRLDVAKTLLASDGALIVAIDEEEQAHLGVLLKEMFPEHEVHCITIIHNPRGVQGTNFSYTHEYAFFVIPKGKKSIGHKRIEKDDISWRNLRDNGGESLRSDARNCFYGIVVENNEIVGFTDVVPNDSNPDAQTVKEGNKFIIYPVDPEGTERKWRYARQSVDKVKHLLRAKNNKTRIEIELGKDFRTYPTVWQDPKYDANEYGTKLVKSLVPGSKFDFPKSLWNVYDCLYAVVGEDKNAIVLDFFGGSGTTAHAVLELNKRDGGNRKFILTEQMHYVESITAARIHQVIKNNQQGSFIYCELAKANQTFADLIEQALTGEELNAIYAGMQSKAFLSYRIDLTAFNASKQEFEALDFAIQKAVLMEMLDKNLLYVPLSEIDDETFGISDADKALNHRFYGLDK